MKPIPDISYKGDITCIDHPRFHIQLPFHWSFHANDGEQVEYRNQTLPEQLFIRLQATTRTLSGDEMTDIREHVVDSIRKAALANGSPQLRLSHPTMQDAHSDVEARLFAVDPPNEVAFGMLLRLTPIFMLQVSLYRYTLVDLVYPA